MKSTEKQDKYGLLRVRRNDYNKLRALAEEKHWTIVHTFKTIMADVWANKAKYKEEKTNEG